MKLAWIAWLQSDHHQIWKKCHLPKFSCWKFIFDELAQAIEFRFWNIQFTCKWICWIEMFTSMWLFVLNELISMLQSTCSVCSKMFCRFGLSAWNMLVFHYLFTLIGAFYYTFTSIIFFPFYLFSLRYKWCKKCHKDHGVFYSFFLTRGLRGFK